MADETTLTPERIAHTFHDAYEALAPAFGYRTREASSKPWEQIPASNRDLMIATVRAVFYERDGAFFVCGPSAPIAAAQVETLTRERDEAIRQRDEARRERDHAGDILAIVRRQPLVLR